MTVAPTTINHQTSVVNDHDISSVHQPSTHLQNTPALATTTCDTQLGNPQHPTPSPQPTDIHRSNVDTHQPEQIHLPATQSVVITQTSPTTHQSTSRDTSDHNQPQICLPAIKPMTVAPTTINHQTLYVVNDHDTSSVRHPSTHLQTTPILPTITSETELGSLQNPTPSLQLTSENAFDLKLVQCIPPTLPLSDAEKSVLSKGLKFVPLKSKANKSQVYNDLERFFRSLRWMAVLGNRPTFQKTDDVFIDLFKNQCKREPPHGKHLDLEYYIIKCLNDIKRLKFKPLKHLNLSSAELEALQNLRARDDIVIKPADKGGAVVVWDRNLYIQEALHQLEKPQHYTPCEESSLPNDAKIIMKTVKHMIQDEQLPSTARLLIKKRPRQSVLYLLPKIHKLNNPGRPIVSACNCPTENISAYLDTIFQPLVQDLPSYIKDTNHALEIIDKLNKSQTFQPTLLFTMDVTSLYTVIPHKDGLTALKHFLDKRQPCSPPTHTLLRLAELVLTLNCFSFNDDSYSQTSGVAMGTNMGPSYACLFMGHLEHLIFQQWCPKPVPEFYKRFIDDGIGATDLTPTQLEDFINFANKFHPAINFTYQISKTSVTFLDLNISLDHGNFKTSIFYKPTDSHSYLDFRSSHHERMKMNIPYSQFLRLRRICSDEDDFVNKAEEMSTFFSRRHYPEHVIRDALKKVNGQQKKVSKPVVQDNNERPIASFVYHPHLLPVHTILLKNWKLLTSNPELAKTFDQPPLVAFRRDTNIRDLLVRSSLRRPLKHPPGTKQCSVSKCKTCPFICSSTHVDGPASTFTITRHFTCQSTNLVYAITCTKCCDQHYIGETERPLKERFEEHLRNIRYHNDTSVANHFNQADHSVHHVRVKGIWLVHGNTDDRKYQEKFLIKRIGTLKPHGMNEKL